MRTVKQLKGLKLVIWLLVKTNAPRTLAVKDLITPRKVATKILVDCIQQTHQESRQQILTKEEQVKGHTAEKWDVSYIFL